MAIGARTCIASQSMMHPCTCRACSAEVRAETGFDSEAAAVNGASSSRGTVQGFPPWIPGAVDARSLTAFYQHADSTNDIFRVAARLVAQIMCKVRASPLVTATG
jgi:hypothetical protein